MRICKEGGLSKYICVCARVCVYMYAKTGRYVNICACVCVCVCTKTKGNKNIY